MARAAFLRRRAAHLAHRILERERVEPLRAARTLVAARVGIAAERARPGDVAIREEHLVLRAVELLGLALEQVAVLVQAPEELLRQLRMARRDARARPRIEDDAQAIEGRLDHRAPLRDVLGIGDAVLLRADRDRDAVLVG